MSGASRGSYPLGESCTMQFDAAGDVGTKVSGVEGNVDGGVKEGPFEGAKVLSGGGHG